MLFPLILIALCVMVIAYRYYSAFIAAKMLALDGARVTPAHEHNDGQNFIPTTNGFCSDIILPRSPVQAP